VLKLIAIREWLAHRIGGRFCQEAVELIEEATATDVTTTVAIVAGIVAFACVSLFLFFRR
jgi:hypothetical protein